MAIIDIGNNIYLGRKTLGDSPSNAPSVQNAIYIDLDSGVIYLYFSNTWNAASFGTKGDQLFIPILRQMAMSNVGSTYVDVYPSFYDGLPIPFSTVGYKNFGIVVLWNKNSSNIRHDIRVVDAADTTKVLVDSEGLTTDNGGDPVTGGIKSGRTKNYNIALPTYFQEFRGEVKVQAKCASTASPIFDGILVYLIRG